MWLWMGYQTDLAILKRARMERHGAIGEEGLHLCHKQVTFFKEGTHLELIALQFSSLLRPKIMRRCTSIIMA